MTVVTRYVLPIDQVEKEGKYVGIVETNETERVRDETHALFTVEMSWFVVVERQTTDIQDFIKNLKLYIYSASISNMKRILFSGTEIVHIEDLDEDKYGSVVMKAEFIYAEAVT